MKRTLLAMVIFAATTILAGCSEEEQSTALPAPVAMTEEWFSSDNSIMNGTVAFDDYRLVRRKEAR